MAYTIISQNNTTTTLSDENGNVITVPARVTLATSTDYTIIKVNNNSVDLEDGDGKIIRGVPACVVLAGGGGGGDQHNLGYYATQAALEEAYPTAEAGDWAIVGATDTVWIWDTDNSEWVDSDQKGQVTSVNGQTGDVVLDLLPTQTGNAGKFLTTDGTDASWSDKPLVNTATGNNSVGIFGTGSATNAVSVGKQANTSGGSSIAIGYASGNSGGANSAIAIGYMARCEANRAIQLGRGATNSDANTFKVANENGNFEIMSADGTVPTARLTKVNTTATLAVADWSSSTQTVTVSGVTATSVVFVSPAPASASDYASAGILCTAQAANSLTFTCTTTPTNAITVNVVCM